MRLAEPESYREEKKRPERINGTVQLFRDKYMAKIANTSEVDMTKKIKEFIVRAMKLNSRANEITQKERLQRKGYNNIDIQKTLDDLEDCDPRVDETIKNWINDAMATEYIEANILIRTIPYMIRDLLATDSIDPDEQTKKEAVCIQSLKILKGAVETSYPMPPPESSSLQPRSSSSLSTSSLPSFSQAQ